MPEVDPITNTTDETIAEAIRDVLPLKRQAAAASGKLSKAYSKWEAAGVPRKALQEALKKRDVEKDEVVSDLAMQLRILKVMNITIDQGDIFPRDALSVKDKIREEMTMVDVEDAGYAAGKAGRPVADNPYNDKPGSEYFITWRDGWEKGQLENAMPNGDGPKTANTERRPRKSAAAGEAQA